MSSIRLYTSDYKSDMTPQDRKWADDVAKTCVRTEWYNTSPEKCHIINEWTREKLFIEMFFFDWSGVVKRLGLILAPTTTVWEVDEKGEKVLGEDGKPIVKHSLIPNEKFGCTVKAEGLVDANGTTIKPGYRKFTYLLQETNRPLNETNWKENVMPRIPKWMINGESLIKDSNEKGISEQHTCVARAVQFLTGEVSDPTNQDMMKIAVGGIHPMASITADTGKANTGADIFGSDPEIVPVDILQTVVSYLRKEGEAEVLVEKQTAVRTKACGVTQSAAKILLYRLSARDVNTSLGSGQKSTQLAHMLSTRVLPDLDDLAAMCYTFVKDMPHRKTPVSDSHLTAALALWYLRDAAHIDVARRPSTKGYDGGTPLADYPIVRFDLDLAIPFLRELSLSLVDSRFSSWTAERLRDNRKKDKPTQKFAQLVRLIQNFNDGGIVDESILLQEHCGKSDAKNFLHFGGMDRGPFVVEKVEEPDAA